MKLSDRMLSLFNCINTTKEKSNLVANSDPNIQE